MEQHLDSPRSPPPSQRGSLYQIILERPKIDPFFAWINVFAIPDDYNSAKNDPVRAWMDSVPLPDADDYPGPKLLPSTATLLGDLYRWLWMLSSYGLQGHSLVGMWVKRDPITGELSHWLP
jgi:hypothetical protein